MNPNEKVWSLAFRARYFSEEGFEYDGFMFKASKSDIHIYRSQYSNARNVLKEKGHQIQFENKTGVLDDELFILDGCFIRLSVPPKLQALPPIELIDIFSEDRDISRLVEKLGLPLPR